MRFVGEMRKQYKISNQMRELSRIRDDIEQRMLALGFSSECRADVQLICEELLCNIISYGFPKQESHSVEMQFVFDGQSLTLRFIDDGMAFNPLDQPNPALDDPEADDRPVGGLGIYLVKNLTSEQQYEYRNGKNQLTVRRSIDQAPAGKP